MQGTRPPDVRRPTPVQTDGVAVVIAGTVLWAVAFVVLLFFRHQLAEHDAQWWIWVCVAGVGIGLIGLVLTTRHRTKTRQNPPGQ